MDRNIALSFRNVRSLNCVVLGDQVSRLVRWSVWLFGFGGCFRSKDVLFEEALLDELFQILLDVIVVDSFMSLTVMVRAIFFYSGKHGIVRIGLGRLTNHWSLIVLKTSLIGNLNEVKCHISV